MVDTILTENLNYLRGKLWFDFENIQLIRIADRPEPINLGDLNISQFIQTMQSFQTFFSQQSQIIQKVIQKASPSQKDNIITVIKSMTMTTQLTFVPALSQPIPSLPISVPINTTSCSELLTNKSQKKQLDKQKQAVKDQKLFEQLKKKGLIVKVNPFTEEEREFKRIYERINYRNKRVSTIIQPTTISINQTTSTVETLTYTAESSASKVEKFSSTIVRTPTSKVTQESKQSLTVETNKPPHLYQMSPNSIPESTGIPIRDIYIPDRSNELTSKDINIPGTTTINGLLLDKQNAKHIIQLLNCGN